MKIREMISKIEESGNLEKIKELHELFDEVICDLKIAEPKMYHKYKTCLYELAYGKVILEEKAVEIVERMRPEGEYFSMDKAKEIKNQYGFQHSASDVYLVLNAVYNDYCNTFKDESNEIYIKLAKDWLDDKDAVEDKVYIYFMNIPKKD